MAMHTDDSNPSRCPSPPSPPSPGHDQRKRRRRRLPSLKVSVPFALLLSLSPHLPATSAAEERIHQQHPQDQQDPSHRKDRQGQPPTNFVSNFDSNFESNSNPRELNEDLPSKFRQLKEGTFQRWKSDPNAYVNLRPLDLVLDDTDHVVPGEGDGSVESMPRVYQVGKGGFLEPYDMEDYQSGSVVVSVTGNGGGGSGSGSGEGDANDANGDGESALSSTPIEHEKSSRLGRTNFDINRGVGGGGYLLLGEEATGRTRSLRGDSSPTIETKDFFTYSEFDDPHEADFLDSPDQRNLVRNSPQKSFDDSSTSATSFASRHRNKNQPNQETRNNNMVTESSDSTKPIIRATFPTEGLIVGDTQSFGALVSDDGSGVASVCVQFRDHVNNGSKCFPLNNVGADVWELSFDGFGAFPDMEWRYRMKVKDNANNKMNTSWKMFRIAGTTSGSSGVAATDGPTSSPTSSPSSSPTSSPTFSPTKNPTYDTTTSGPTSSPTSSPTNPPTHWQAPPAAEKLLDQVSDDNWPHGGIVQVSTGRILFFMGGGSYVCSATVIDDGDQYDDRTILLTAGHCAYQYRNSGQGGGRFAEEAYFIPNQVDTQGTKTNEECGDDPLGCWVPAFAVVDINWATKQFPTSVPWDYAFYVIPNDPAAHVQGFLPTGTSILERDVSPIPLDFYFDDQEFVHGLGYSFDKDPDFRYCADGISTRNGISTYTNLWIPICRMTGGASGGPWMVEMDENGRGVVVSVNSWGYTSSPGMAGPNLNTESGAVAECLFEKARTTDFNSVTNRGIVVDSSMEC